MAVLKVCSASQGKKQHLVMSMLSKLIHKLIDWFGNHCDGAWSQNGKKKKSAIAQNHIELTV